MIELALRLSLSGLGAVGAWWMGPAFFEVAWRACAFQAAYAVFVWRLEARNLRNSGVAGIVGVADAVVLAYVLAAAQRIEVFGFLVLAPIAYAAARFGSLPSAMAPLAAASLLAGHALQNGPAEPQPVLYAQMAGVMAVGMLLTQRRIVVTVNRPALVEAFEPGTGPIPDSIMELRESYRLLRDRYRSLEEKTKKDRLRTQVLELQLEQGDRFFKALTQSLRETTGVQGVAVYTLAQYAQAMVVRDFSGSAALRDQPLAVDLSMAAAQVRHFSEKALQAVANETTRARVSNVVLRHRGRVVGLLSLSDDRPATLDSATTQVEQMEADLARAIAQEQRRAAHERRTRQAELLYALASTVSGADTANRLAARAVRAMGPSFGAESFEIAWIENGALLPSATHGTPIRFLEHMSFAEGPGVEGWLRVGAPELGLFHAAEDSRVPTEFMLRNRVRSFLLVPLRYDEQPAGVLMAASSVAGALDIGHWETLRLLGAEIGQALGRLADASQEQEGLMTPGEFQERVANHANQGGCLVYLEPLRRQALLAEFGGPVVEQALRLLERRVRAKLPAGGCLTRRSAGDFVAFLPGRSGEFASSWANEAAATASFIGIPLPDGKGRMPLPMRARVAELPVAQQRSVA